MILPTADPSQGKLQGTGLAFKALPSLALPTSPASLFTLSLPHSYNRAVRILPIPLHQLLLQSGMPLLLLALFLPEYSCSYSKAQRRGPSSRQIPQYPSCHWSLLLGPSCSRWTAQTLLTRNLSVSSLCSSPGFLSLCAQELRKAWVIGLLTAPTFWPPPGGITS